MSAFHDFARDFAQDAHVRFPEFAPAALPPDVTARYIFELEELHKVCDVYHWLAGRFPQAFCDAEAASAARQVVADRIGEALRQPLAVHPDADEGNRFTSAVMLDDVFLD